MADLAGLFGDTKSNQAQPQVASWRKTVGEAVPTITNFASPFLGEVLGDVPVAAAGTATAGTDGLAAPSILPALAARQGIKASIGGIAGSGSELARETIEGLPIDPKRIAASGAEQAAWAQLPGGGMANTIENPLLRMGTKAAIRGVGGAGIGAGTQALENVQQGQPVGKNVPASAISSGVLTPAIGSLADTGGWYSGQLKDAIGKITGASEDEQKAIYQEGAKKIAGIGPHEDAINRGIIPSYDEVKSSMKTNGFINPETLNKTEANRAKAAAALEQNYQALLKGKEINPSSGESLKQSILQDVGANPVTTDLSGLTPNEQFQYASAHNNPSSPVSSQTVQDMLDQEQTPAQLSQMNKDIGKIVKQGDFSTLNGINQVKRQVGNLYEKGTISEKTYSTLQGFIEKSVGGTDVKNMNQEAKQYMDMKSNINAIKNGFKKGNYPAGHDLGSIQKRIENAPFAKLGAKTPAAIQALKIGGMLAAPAVVGTGVGLATNNPLYGLGAGSLTLGSTGFALHRGAHEILGNPEVLQSIQKLLTSKGAGKLAKPMSNALIQDIMKAINPSAVQNVSSNLGLQQQ